MESKKLFRNEGDELTVKQILDAIGKLLDDKNLHVVEGHNLDRWISFLMTRVNQKLGRTKIG